MLNIKYDPTRPEAFGQYYVELVTFSSTIDMKPIKRFGYWCDLAHIQAGILPEIVNTFPEEVRVQLEKRNGWKPINTAPKDGTHILTYSKHHPIVETWWTQNIMNAWVWGGTGWNYPEYDNPTHWRPLPEKPNEEE